MSAWDLAGMWRILTLLLLHRSGEGMASVVVGRKHPPPPILDLLVTLLLRGQLRDFGKLSPNCVCWASQVWQEAGRDEGFLSWGSRSASGGSMGPFKWEQKFVCNCFFMGLLQSFIRFSKVFFMLTKRLRKWPTGWSSPQTVVMLLRLFYICFNYLPT